MKSTKNFFNQIQNQNQYDFISNQNNQLITDLGTDPLNEEEALNLKETKEQITQEEYKFFTYALSHNNVKLISIHNCMIQPFLSHHLSFECSI